MFSFQGASSPFPLSNQKPLTLGFSLVRLDVWVIRDSVKSQIPLGFQSISQLPNDSICEVVGQNGLEPSTSRLSVVCSSQLSYWPMWWRLRESNPWPPACKAGALPAELNPHIRFWVTPFQGPQNRTISTLLVSVTCSRKKSSSMLPSCLTP